MIPQHLINMWKNHEVSERVIAEMQEVKDNLTKLMKEGFFTDRADMEKTFGGNVYAAAKMEGLNEFFNIISGGSEDED